MLVFEIDTCVFIFLLQNLNRPQKTEHDDQQLLNLHQQDLVNLSKINGRMNQKGNRLEDSDQNVGLVQNKDDEQLLELLHTSQNVFQQTFNEYLKLWGLIGDREDVRKLYQLWFNHLQDIQRYLKEPIPGSKEQLMEDSSLCSLYETIIKHKAPPRPRTLQQQPSSTPGSDISYETLEKLQNSIEDELIERQAQIQLRLNAWNSYQNSKEALCAWLSNTEKDKRALELPFLQLQRLPSTQQRIQVKYYSITLQC